MSTLSDFPRFLELPKEVQIQIWNHATSPGGIKPVDKIVLHYLGCQVKLNEHAFTALFRCVRFNYNPEFKMAGLARLNLMDTGALARLTVLESWRVDIQSLPRAPGTIFTQHHARILKRGRVMLANIFIELIRKLKDDSTAGV